MTVRPATALTALALAAVATTSLTACGSKDKAATASAPEVTPVAAVEADTTPLQPGTFRAGIEGALVGTVQQTSPVTCGIDSDGTYNFTLNGRLNGVDTKVDVGNVSYKGPGPVPIADSPITVDVAQSTAQKDWRNQSNGDGGLTYDPDGRSGAFDVTLPQIDWNTADALPHASTVHLVGRWSCGTVKN